MTQIALPTFLPPRPSPPFILGERNLTERPQDAVPFDELQYHGFS